MLSVELRTKDLENKLGIFASGLGNIYNQLISEVGNEMTSKVKANAASAFNNRTGRLFNSIKFIINKDIAALTTRKSLKKPNIYYAKFVEFGADIKAKKSEYLIFKINGEWKKVKSVKIKPHPFFQPVREEYFSENGKLYRTLQETLMNKINKEFI